MTVTLPEALAGCLSERPDAPDDLFELVAGLAVDDGCSAASEWLLRHTKLPFDLAQKLAARRGVSTAELVSFVSREDIPPGTLVELVRNERRVTVLAVIAAKPDLPREVYEMLAARDGISLRDALLFNKSVPADIWAGIAAELIVAGRMADDGRHGLRHILNGSELLQRAVFDRLSSDMLLKHVVFVSGWKGMATPQLHRLLDAVEQRVVTALSHTVDDTCQYREHYSVVATNSLAVHPSADTALLDRLDRFAAAHPVCCSATLGIHVAATRRRCLLFGDSYVQLLTASHSRLGELADSGALFTASATQRALSNPLFDADVAVRILAAANRRPLPNRDFVVEGLLRDWAPDLVTALRVQRFTHDGLTVFPSGLSKHVRAASIDELIAALDSVADSPEWAFQLAVEISQTGITDDEVVGRFGWFPDRVPAAGTRRRVFTLTVDYLYRRFGAHPPTWRMFGSIADTSTSLVEAAALAVHAEPPPNLPEQLVS